MTLLKSNVLIGHLDGANLIRRAVRLIDRVCTAFRVESVPVLAALWTLH